MPLRTVDYIYVLLSCAAGIWQWWCFTFGRGGLLMSIALMMLVSVPFALASHAWALVVSMGRSPRGRPSWRRFLVLWAGMPVSLIVGSLAVAAETGMLGFRDDPLFPNLRIAVGECMASLAWAACLLGWSHGLVYSRLKIVRVFAVLLAGVLPVHALSVVILRVFDRDVYLLSTSIVATALSALVLAFDRRQSGSIAPRRATPA